MEQLKYKKLLEQYFDGSSSADEENRLKDFLRKYTGDDAEFVEAKMLFGFLQAESQKTVQINFDDIVNNKSKVKIRRIYAFVGSIAASLIIAISITVLININKQPIVYAYVNGQPITNKQEAIKYSQQALLSIQSNLNKGTQGLNYMNKLNKPVELLTVKN